jgi:carbamoyl-phosphate synthase small subunit
MDMVLVMEDGMVFRGASFGAGGEACGWVHDDHRVVGYQEILTDPDNAGCLINMTYPLIGNYGTNGEDSESGRVQAGALIVKEKSRIVSNWRATDTLENMMKDGNAIGMEKVDTRSLSLYIRDHGEMKGIVGSAATPIRMLLDKLKTWQEPNLSRFQEKPKTFAGKSAYRVALYDLGVKKSTLNQLQQCGCDVVKISPAASWEEVRALKPDGLVISSGPGDPNRAGAIVSEIGKAFGRLPVLGIALGAQLICLAAGGAVTRMKVGHHGVNYAVRDIDEKSVAITAQNHSYVMAAATGFRKEFKVSHINVNDGTVEGISSGEDAVLGVQFIPLSDEEGRPNAVFGQFVQKMKK